MQDNSLRQAWLTISPPEQTKYEITLWGGVTWTIGRHASCKVVLADRFISRVHAAINSVLFQNQYLFFITDHHSSNGTLYNGNYLTHSALLHDRDVLILGQTMVVFHYPNMFKLEHLSEPPSLEEISLSSLPWLGVLKPLQ